MNSKQAKFLNDRQATSRGKRHFKSLSHIEKGKLRTAHEAGEYPGVPYTQFVQMILG